MSDLKYLTADRVDEVKVTPQPHNPNVFKIPTRYMLKIGPRWHRVYMMQMQYSNSGSPYVLIKGETHHLDIDTEHMLQKL